MAMKQTLKRLQKGVKQPIGDLRVAMSFFIPSIDISLKEVQEEIILFLINMAFFVTLFATV